MNPLYDEAVNAHRHDPIAETEIVAEAEAAIRSTSPWDALAASEPYFTVGGYQGAHRDESAEAHELSKRRDCEYLRNQGRPCLNYHGEHCTYTRGRAA